MYGIQCNTELEVMRLAFNRDGCRQLIIRTVSLGLSVHQLLLQLLLELFSLGKIRLHGDLITAFHYLIGAYKKDEKRVFTGHVKGRRFKLKEQIQIGYKEEIHDESVEALEHVSQRSYECPILGDVQDQTEWRSDLVGGIFAHGMGLQLDDL